MSYSRNISWIALSLDHEKHIWVISHLFTFIIIPLLGIHI